MGLRSIERSGDKDTLIIRGQDGKTIDVESFCMSCKAARPVTLANETLIGVVVYSWKGQTDFRLNGVHCKSGYVYIRRASELDSASGRSGHHRLLSELFGNCIIDNNDFVATGFCVKDGDFQFKSGAFNGQVDNWRNGSTVGVPMLEKEYICASVNQWVALKGSHSAKILRVMSKSVFPMSNKDIDKTVTDVDKTGSDRLNNTNSKGADKTAIDVDKTRSDCPKSSANEDRKISLWACALCCLISPRR